LQGVKEEKKRKATRTSNLIQQSVVNSIEGQGQKRKKRDDPPQRDHVNARNGAYSEISSSSTSWATLNWSRTRAPQRTNHRAAACALATYVRMDQRSSEPVALIRSALCCPYFGQCNKTWRTVCACQPQSQRGRISGTCVSGG
jgi:hypothetical protein